MKRPSYLTLAIIAGAVLLVSIIAFKRYLPYTGRGFVPKQPPPIVLSMENAYFVGLDRGGKLWSIKAKKVELAQDRALTTITGIKDGKIFDKGKVALKMSAGRAIYNIYGKDLQLLDGILIEGNDGQRIYGPAANWNSMTAMLRSNGRVTYESGLSKVTADTLVVDVRNKEMNMWNVGMSIDMKELENVIGREAERDAR